MSKVKNPYSLKNFYEIFSGRGTSVQPTKPVKKQIVKKTSK